MHLNLDMHLDDDAQDPPVPPLPDLGRKREAIYSVRHLFIDASTRFLIL
jgi:hypothetical protein